MSDLNLSTGPERTSLKPIVISVGVLFAVLVVLYFTTWRKTATVTLVNAQVFAPHTEFTQMKGSLHVVGEAAQAEDNVYVAVTVRLKDNMRIPITFTGASAVLSNQADEQLEATAVSARDLPNIEASFPALTPMMPAPLATNEEIAPGATREGSVLILFPGATQDIWKQKKSAKLTLHLAHQDPITIDIP